MYNPNDVIPILTRLEQGMTVTEIANALDVSSAHISLIKNKHRLVGPTVRRALINKGWIPAPPKYPYFKINRFDAERAAGQIVRTLGSEFADALIAQLRLAQEGKDVTE